MAGRVSFLALAGLPEVKPGDDLAILIGAALDAGDIPPAPRDIFVVAQKIVSKAEGRFVDLTQAPQTSSDISPTGSQMPRLVGLAYASRLYRVDIKRPSELVGKNTASAMQAGIYFGYVEMVDGILRLGPSPESSVLAAVPLRVQDEIVGALVLLKLFDHKPILRSEDRDLLDLLSAHAASALFAARLFATKDRKLRTLESLVKLARGE